MASLLSFAKGVARQVNVFDNGRTFQNQTPTNNRSVIGQLTHNGLTNTAGNLGVKPFVLNPAATTIVEPARNLTADLTHNAAALQASNIRQQQNLRESLPGFFIKQGANAGQAGYNLGFKAPILDLKGNQRAAEQARVQGIREFNQTLPGQAVRPIQEGIANLAHANPAARANVGLNPNATGAQKYFADPLMGTLGTLGIGKGAKSLLPDRGKTVTKETPTVKQLPVTKPVSNKPAYLRQRPLSQNKKTVTNAELKYRAQQSSVRDTGTPTYIRQLQGSLGKLLSQAAPALTPKDRLALPSSTGPIQGKGFTMTAAVNPTTIQLGKQIASIDRQLEQVRQGKSTKSATELRALTKQRQDLALQVGKPRPTNAPIALNEMPKTPETKPTLNQKLDQAQGIKNPNLSDKAPAPPKGVPVNSNLAGLPEPSTYTGAPKTPNTFQRAWQTVNGVISQHGVAGKELARRLGEHRNQSEIGQEAFLEKIPSVGKLSKDDFTTFVQGLERLSNGEQVNLAPHIQQAIDEWNKAIPSIRNRAVAAGLNVGDLGENYFPRQYKDLFKSDKKMGQLAEQMVRDGKAKDLGDAMGKLQFMKNEYQRPFGNLESTRTTNLPGYEQTHEALTNYISRSFDRITKAEQFGSKNEILHELQAHAQQEGYNAAPGSTLDKYIKIALGDVDKSTNAHKFSSGVRKFNALRSLSTAGVSNATQLTNTATIAGIGRTAKGVYKLATSQQARQQARQSGVLLDHSINQLAQQGLGTTGRVTSNIASPFFRSVEKFNRQTTAIVGKDYGNHLAKKGDVAQLRDKFGVTGDIGKTLTRDQEIQVSRKMVELSQFKVNPMDLPGWVDSPMGKLAAQFRTFGYKQSDFMYNQVLREAVKGNFLPLARFVAVGVPAGGAALVAKGAIKRAPYIQSSDNNTTKVAQSLAQVGGFGLPGSEGLNIYNSARFKNTPAAVVGTVGGPTASFITETGDNIRSGQQGRGYDKLKKEALRNIPAVGPTIANTVYPKTAAPAPPDNKTTKLSAKGNTVKMTARELIATNPDELTRWRGLTAEAQANVALNNPTKFSRDTQLALQSDKTQGNTTQLLKDQHSMTKAQLSADKTSFDKSGQSYQVVGDTVLRRGSDGNITATPKIKFDYQVGTATLTSQKNADNLQGWLKTANSQIDSINKQLQDPSIDPLEALTLQNDASTIQSNINKYTSYGGFTKPKSATSQANARVAAFNKGTSAFKTAKGVKAPQGIKIRVAKTSGASPKLKRIAVSKIPSNYLNKRLV